jgi:hypothetical protein
MAQKEYDEAGSATETQSLANTSPLQDMHGNGSDYEAMMIEKFEKIYRTDTDPSFCL